MIERYKGSFAEKSFALCYKEGTRFKPLPSPSRVPKQSQVMVSISIFRGSIKKRTQNLNLITNELFVIRFGSVRSEIFFCDQFVISTKNKFYLNLNLQNIFPNFIFKRFIRQVLSLLSILLYALPPDSGINLNI